MSPPTARFRAPIKGGVDMVVTVAVYFFLAAVIIGISWVSLTFNTADLTLNSLQNLALIFSDTNLAWPSASYKIFCLVFPVLLFGIPDTVFPTCGFPAWTW